MKTFKIALVAAVSVSLLGLAATTARADDWKDHEDHAREWHHHHHHGHAYGHDHDHDGPVIVQEPNVVYVPPVVVEPPPAPEVDAPGINLIFPIKIR